MDSLILNKDTYDIHFFIYVLWKYLKHYRKIYLIYDLDDSSWLVVTIACLKDEYKKEVHLAVCS